MCWLLHRNADKGMTPFEANQLLLSKRDVRRKLFTQPNILVRAEMLQMRGVLARSSQCETFVVTTGVCMQRFYNEVVKGDANGKAKY